MKKILLIVVCCTFLLGCRRLESDYELEERALGRDTIQLIEQHTLIDLPTDARGLNFFYKAPIDPGFVAKIEIPARSKDDLLRRLSKIENQEIHVSGALGPRFKWWTPAKGRVLIDRQKGTGDSYLHIILTDEEGRTILYLEWCVV